MGSAVVGPQRLRGWIVGALVLSAALLANVVFFRFVLDTGYGSWWLANGALIAILTSLSFATFLRELDEPSLVSLNPLIFVAGVLIATTVLTDSLSQFLRPGRRDVQAEARDDRLADSVDELQEQIARLSPEMRAQYEEVVPKPRTNGPGRWGRRLARGGAMWDVLVSLVIVGLLLVLWIGWVLVIAPMMYLVTLVAGAPARRVLRGETSRTDVVRNGDSVTIVLADAGPEVPPAPGTITLLVESPVATTQALIALLAAIVRVV